MKHRIRRIAIGLSFYQDYDSLRRMIKSIDPYPIDLILAIDGKYKEHPAAPELSDKQKCIDIFESSEIPYHYIEAPGLTQREKRQIYFDMCRDLHREIDLLFVMDSDEYIVQQRTDWCLFLCELQETITKNNAAKQGYYIPVIRKDWRPERIQMLPRLFYRPGNLEYDHLYNVCDRDTGIDQTSRRAFSYRPHIILANDHNLRDIKYETQRRIYRDTLRTRELVIQTQEHETNNSQTIN